MVVVDYVLANQPPQVRFVHRDDVVEKLAPTASDPTLGGSILPGRLNTRAFRLEVRRLQERDHIFIELRIVVEDHVTILTTLGKRFPQLLYDPIGTRLAGDIECRILRLECSITKKQYRSLKVRVGTAKKSMAAITSR